MKQRRFRNKPIATPDEEEEEEDGPGIVIGQTASTAAAQREKERKERKASRAAVAAAPGQQRAGGNAGPLPPRKPLLSFEDHEEVPPPQKSKEGGKPKAGRGFTAAVPKQREAPQSTQISAPGEYSAERLNALHSSTRVLPARPQPKEPAFKLSGSFKASAVPSDDRFTVNAKDMMKEVPFEAQGGRSRGAAPPSGLGQAALLPPPPRPGRQDPGGPQPGAPAAAAAARPSAAATGAAGPGYSSEEEGFTVPDAAAIRRAKEKRERLRSAHLAPDYVPLGGAAGLTASSNKQAAARLRGQRDDDGGAASEEEEDEEDGIRMQFVGAARPGKPRAAPQAAAGEDQEEGPEDDDEAWVRQQISKGAGRQASAATASRAAPGGRSASDVFSSGAASGASALSQGAGGAGPDRAAAAGAAVLASLRAGMAQLQASHTHVKKQLDRTAGQLADSISSVSGLEAQLSAAKAKYTYMQEKRGYIADLCDMLQMKAPIVEVLEERAMEAAEERAAAAVGSAAADDTEELRAPEAAVAAALGVLSRGGAAPAAQSAAASAARETDSYVGVSLPEQLDEFGRDMNVEKRREAVERAERRKARYAVEAARVAAARRADQLEEAWGEDTTDEDEPEVARHGRERAQILEAASTVFADAGEDYADIAAVKRRLEDWRAHYPSTFNDAYMGVSAPAIFAPFVRSQLISWDPLFAPGTGFDSQNWYQQLFDYGMQPDANGAGPKPSAEDEELVPALVQRIVARRALHAIEHVWNPLSAKQSVAVAALLKDLQVYLLPDDPILQEMVKAVEVKLAEAAERMLVPAWPRAAVAVAPAAIQTQGRRFGRAVRLLRSIAAFEGAMPTATLRPLALDTIFARQLLALIRGTPTNPALTLERMARCVLAVPSSWLAQNHDKRASPMLEQLQAVSRVVQSSKQDAESRSVLDSRLSKLMSHVRASV